MLSYVQCVGIILLCVVLAWGLLYLLDCRLEETTRKRANGVNGWQLSILGTLYAVALGFMLSDAWLAYQTALADVRAEASAVLLVDRNAQLMPVPCSQQLQEQSNAYLEAVINKEWSAMQEHRTDRSGEMVLRDMWSTLGSCGAHDSITVRGNVVEALSALQIRRDARVQDFEGRLPVIMWDVLLFGGVILITASCLLCNERRWVHLFHVTSLTVLVVMSLLAIADLDRPFEGATHIDASAFRTVQGDLQIENSR
ncbi:bestrophin-like domain [Terriglobus sp. ADX1]|uniref:bestrophin-like domain n=1 Tax=Terriglobus sp. ADX1 TaxID=2794063 RepID=UPI002FE5A388